MPPRKVSPIPGNYPSRRRLEMTNWLKKKIWKAVEEPTKEVARDVASDTAKEVAAETVRESLWEAIIELFLETLIQGVIFVVPCLLLFLFGKIILKLALREACDEERGDEPEGAGASAVS